MLFKYSWSGAAIYCLINERYQAFIQFCYEMKGVPKNFQKILIFNFLQITKITVI